MVEERVESPKKRKGRKIYRPHSVPPGTLAMSLERHCEPFSWTCFGFVLAFAYDTSR